MEVSELYKLVLLVGGVLMFIMSFVLWFSPKALFPNRILGTLIFAWGFCVMVFATQSNALYYKFPHLLGIGSTITFLFFPLMYMYVKSYLFVNERKLYKYIIHVLPLIIFVTFLSSFYFQNADVKRALINNGLPDTFFATLDYGALSVVILGVFYTVLSFRVIHKFEEINDRTLKGDQLKIIRWIKGFLGVNILFWAIGTAGVINEVAGLNFNFSLYNVYYLGLTLLNLWLSIVTIFNPDIYALNSKTEIAESTNYKAILNHSNRVNKENASAVLQKVTSSTEEDQKEVKFILNFIETQKPYLNSSLSLPDLSNQMGMTKHRVSELLNSYMGYSFSDIINEFRVKEVIRLIDEGKHEHYNLVHLSELAGFNSKATFNRIFKKSTGKTPTQFIQELAA